MLGPLYVTHLTQDELLLQILVNVVQGNLDTMLVSSVLLFCQCIMIIGSIWLAHALLCLFVLSSTLCCVHGYYPAHSL